MAESRVFIPFRFQVSLFAAGGTAPSAGGELLCGGAFSEVSGLEATMAAKKIVEGGRNWGELQRVGPTSFNTVTLKRGVTSVGDLYTWFDLVTRQSNYGYRMEAQIEVTGGGASGVTLTYRLSNVLPVKFKGPDLNATSTQVAVEEVQLVHEGLTLERAVKG
jgi:phage tail-like protein